MVIIVIIIVIVISTVITDRVPKAYALEVHGLEVCRQLSVSLEKLQYPMNGDVTWQDDVTDSGMQQLGDDVVSKNVR